MQSARLLVPDGAVTCDFADHDLHLGNYSQPYQGKMQLEELQKHLHSLPHLPDAIPYVTSYYRFYLRIASVWHWRMANNELSGPLGLLRMYEHLRDLPRRYFTYRFLLCPETLGSIAYLSRFGDEVKDKIRGGMVLTCLGGHREPLSFKLSRQDWLDAPSPIDNLARKFADASICGPLLPLQDQMNVNSARLGSISRSFRRLEPFTGSSWSITPLEMTSVL